MSHDHPPIKPLVEPIAAGLDAVDVFKRLSVKPQCLFLDSALQLAGLGRYSFIACDPFETIACSAGDSRPFDRLAAALSQMQVESEPGAPPFQGGAAGLFGYELNRALEPSLRERGVPVFDEFQIPALHVGLYDVVAAFDHQENSGWLISTGLPETNSRRRAARARERLQEFQTLLQNELPQPESSATQDAIDEDAFGARCRATPFPGVFSNFDEADYHRAVERAVEYIHAGDIFQVNFAQRLLYRSTEDPRRLHLRMRTRNAAPFAGYYDAGRWQIISASPERFLSARDGLLETRPIKGTRPRVRSPEADLFAASDLLDSEKDNAENVMIVDLLRNDLSRVCEPESVAVRQLCEVETYAYVQHLVSSVEGRLAGNHTPLDALQAAFPGGSITGAPKIRAMEIIAELERTARGAYCGSLGYLGFNGTMDLSILIRTVTACGGWWQFPVGGGIVSQSTPANEYQETWDKAAGMLRALKQ